MVLMNNGGIRRWNDKAWDMRNIIDEHTLNSKNKLSDADTKACREESPKIIATSYKLRFKEDFRGPVYPFGALVQYKPSSDKDKARVHKFGKQMLDGIFLGYHQIAGGGWSDDLKVVDVEALEEADAFHELYTKRIKAE